MDRQTVEAIRKVALIAGSQDQVRNNKTALEREEEDDMYDEGVPRRLSNKWTRFDTCL